MSRSKNSRRGIRMSRPSRELWGRGPMGGHFHSGENKRLARRIARARHAQSDLNLVNDVREGPLRYTEWVECSFGCDGCRADEWRWETDGEPRERWLSAG